MTTLIQDIKDKLSRLNVLEKIIVINLVVFILGIISPIVTDWLWLPNNFNALLSKPWSLITYAFTHYDFRHILFNMIWLYFIGQWFLNLFSPKLALNIYLLGAISGGLIFILGEIFIPEFLGFGFLLVGASASVNALFIFICAYMPHKEIRLLNLTIKLWHIGAFFIVLDVISILAGDNSGGYLSHLGGAILGYVYAKQLLKGNDIGKGFERFTNTIGGFFKRQKSPLKTVYKNKSKVAGYTKNEFNEFNNQKRIDLILDKISKSGYESLTAEEKEFLFKAGK